MGLCPGVCRHCSTRAGTLPRRRPCTGRPARVGCRTCQTGGIGGGAAAPAPPRHSRSRLASARRAAAACWRGRAGVGRRRGGQTARAVDSRRRAMPRHGAATISKTSLSSRCAVGLPASRTTSRMAIVEAWAAVKVLAATEWIAAGEGAEAQGDAADSPPLVFGSKPLQLGAQAAARSELMYHCGSAVHAVPRPRLPAAPPPSEWHSPHGPSCNRHPGFVRPAAETD